MVQKNHQFNFVVNNASIRLQRYPLNACAYNQLFRVQNSCRNNENNMSDSNTGCPIIKVQMWDIMFAREEYLQNF